MPQSYLTVFHSETPDQHSNSRTLDIINDANTQKILTF